MRTDQDRAQFRQLQGARMILWPTAAERALWPILELLGFERQVSMDLPTHRGTRLDGVIFDFYHAKAKLAVEVDGRTHRKGPDGRRDRRALAAGIRTCRFPNRMALSEKGRAEILEIIKELL